MSDPMTVVRFEPSGVTGGMALIGPDGRALAFTRADDGVQIAAAFLAKDAAIKALADALEEAQTLIPPGLRNAATKMRICSALRLAGRLP